ncbi:DUF262 domain-containing protein [Chitinophaga rhizophila]|uniref:DUF262 domain-containing HNH endonuclease family protein n=1 Tax=Chitinophaga rhizophila TaxID=2866212 RepID=A0ABS7G814_9BACT|nr:DUF262 domain-containing protein [Chitinophaga rhizophila]MBW8683536.1 DUF262 domain-containing HNH endonuclease family protein [Chitinophaga rhizophila]
MQFVKRSVFGFFDGTKKSFIIPVYQRAYAWKEKEWSTFLNDLKEQIQGDSNYFFGNILLETIEQDRVFDVIDGQQRLTTLTIFVRSLINILKERIAVGETIDISIAEKEATFLKNGGTIKLRPVDYDRSCYDALIIENKEKFEIASPSQENIRDARAWFIKELRKMPTEDILKILDKIEKTAITSIEFEGKKDAALMFELQNNRGKDLTNMERLKSYFMYQLYVYSKQEEADMNIEYVANLFKAIYGLINDIKGLDEDSILLYHCHTYVKGFDYRNIEDIKAEFKKSSNRVTWINTFVEELHTTFSNMKKLENSKDIYYSLLKRLKAPAFVYPFLIKGYKYFGDDTSKLSDLFKVLEILVFRYAVIRSGATIESRLNQILHQYTGSNTELRNNLKTKLNQEHHWSDERFKSTLDGYMYSTPIVNYLLWRYEASIQSKGYVLGSIILDDEQIEHISPQKPPIDQTLASGYKVNSINEYSEDFLKDYLNSLGNLMLISGNHNRSIGNIPFKEKLSSYNKNPLLNQQGEIKNFVSGDTDTPLWDMKAIDKRHSVILSFAIFNWSF